MQPLRIRMRLEVDEVSLHQYQTVNAFFPTAGTAMVGDGNYTSGAGTNGSATPKPVSPNAGR